MKVTFWAPSVSYRQSADEVCVAVWDVTDERVEERVDEREEERVDESELVKVAVLELDDDAVGEELAVALLVALALSHSHLSKHWQSSRMSILRFRS